MPTSSETGHSTPRNARTHGLRRTPTNHHTRLLEFNRTRRRRGTHRSREGHGLTSRRRIQRRRHRRRSGFLVDRLSQTRRRRSSITAIAGVGRHDTAPTSRETGHSTPRNARTHGLRRTPTNHHTRLLEFNRTRRRRGTHRSREGHGFTNRRRIQRRRHRRRSGFLVDRLSQTRRRRSSITAIAGVGRHDTAPTSSETGHSTRRGPGADGLRRTPTNHHTRLLEFNRTRRRRGTHRSREGHGFTNRRRIQRRRHRRRSGFLVDRLSQTRRRRSSIVTIAGVASCNPMPTSSETGHTTRRGPGADGLRGTPTDHHPGLLEFNRTRRRRGTHRSREGHGFTNRRRIQRRRHRRRSGFLVDRLSQTRRRRSSIVTIAGVASCNPMPTSSETGHTTRRGPGADGLRGTPTDHHPGLLEFNRTGRRRGTHRSREGHGFTNRRRIQRRRHRRRSGFLVDRLSQTRRRRSSIVTIAGVASCNPMPTSSETGHTTRRGSRADGLRGTPTDHHPGLLEFNRTGRRRGTHHRRINHRFANRRRIRRRRQRRHGGGFVTNGLASALTR